MNKYKKYRGGNRHKKKSPKINIFWIILINFVMIIWLCF